MCGPLYDLKPFKIDLPLLKLGESFSREVLANNAYDADRRVKIACCKRDIDRRAARCRRGPPEGGFDIIQRKRSDNKKTHPESSSICRSRRLFRSIRGR